MVLAIYVVLFLVQRWLIFPAYMANIANGVLKTPAEYGVTDFTEIALTAEDGVHILGWAHQPSQGKPVILYLHGNAMHIAARLPRYQAFAKQGYGVFALSYRGYGRSEGSPSEQGFYNDARAAIAWINKEYANPPLIFYGESLGTGVATQMAKEYKPQGLVLQSGYTSIPNVAAEIYWYLPFTYMLIRDKLDSLSKIGDLNCPILIIHGDQDEVIPFEHGQALAQAAHDPKRFLAVTGAGHTNIPDAVIIKAMQDFFTSSGLLQ